MTTFEDEKLHDYLKRMSESCDGAIDNILKDPKYKIRAPVPRFKNGFLSDIREEEIIDYRKIRFDVQKCRLLKDSFFVKSKDILIQSAMKLGIGCLQDNDQDDFAKGQLALFVAQFAKDKRRMTPASVFDTTLSKFYNHLSANLCSTTYITPLYSVRGDFSEIILDKNLRIREIAEHEYSRLVRLSIPMKEIDHNQRRLKFVLSCSVSGPSDKRLQEAMRIYSFVLDLLKLFKDGYPQLGRVYEIESEHLEVGKIESTSSSYENPPVFKQVQIGKKDRQVFAEFYSIVTKRRDEISKPEFLLNSIERFGMAHVQRTSANKIVDYVISLETLLTNSPGESTLKLAHRTTALYADTDAERVETWELMKRAYSFRSGMVHKSKGRPVKIRSTNMRDADVARILDKIAKKSIYRMIGLLEKYKKQEDILDALDRSIYNRKEMDDIREKWRPMFDKFYQKDHNHT